MRADLDTLLPDAGREPQAPLDADALWARGRRRRAVRQVSAAGGGLAGIAALALVATSLVGGAGTAVPEIVPMAPPAGTDQLVTDGDTGEGDGSDLDATDDADVPSTRTDELSAAEEQRLAESGERNPTDGGTEEGGADGSSTTSGGSDATGSPTPDWTRTPDPCAIHDAEEARSFIDVVSPVDGQQIDNPAIALVGCASVYEATVRYRISHDGTVIEDSFLTATEGGPGLGEFREGIPLSTTGTHTLEVFWDSPADGEGERDTQTLSFDVG